MTIYDGSSAIARLFEKLPDNPLYAQRITIWRERRGPKDLTGHLTWEYYASLNFGFGWGETPEIAIEKCVDLFVKRSEAKADVALPPPFALIKPGMKVSDLTGRRARKRRATKAKARRGIARKGQGKGRKRSKRK